MSLEDRFEKQKKMVMLADKLRNALHEENIKAVGSILNEGWLYKRELASGISNDRIDDLYNRFIQHGAMGGKLLGAGGTGFFLIYAENHETLKRILKCKVLPFKIEREGTKIIFYE